MPSPNLFHYYVIISPSLWWGSQALLEKGEALLRADLRAPVNVYIGAPNKEEDERMYRDAAALHQLLKSNGLMQVNFDYLPDELHSTVIHQAVYNAFKTFYPKTAYSK